MIENLAKASEVLDKAKEFSSNFEPNKEIKKGEPLVSNSEYNPDDEVSRDYSDTQEKDGLTREQKKQIRIETNWPNEVINHIDSIEQYKIYKNADLHLNEVNGRTCLSKIIDMDYIDPKTGKTNRERMQMGRTPIDAKTGEKIELHHMGQDKNGPFAELCENTEHGDGNDKLLHLNQDDSWRKEPGAKEQYRKEREAHWKARAKEA